jgi:hypothetical protein
MQPERVRGAWPEARFLARGRLQARPLGAVVPPAGARYQTWGIIIETADAPAIGDARSALTDDGRDFTVTVPPPDDADPSAVLAAARYWELPSAYVGRLALAANAPIEDYVY